METKGMGGITFAGPPPTSSTGGGGGGGIGVINNLFMLPF